MSSDGLDRRIARDTGWNLAALAVTAGVGAATTLLIAGRMGASSLGVFAQLYTVHVVAAQLAVMGIHDSAQKHVAERSGLGHPDDGVAAGAVKLVLFPSSVVALLLWLAAGPLGGLVSSADVKTGLYLVACGIVPFAMNKVLFGILNGRGELRLYALMQIARALLVLAAVAVLARPSMPAYVVGGIFASAELVLLPCLLIAASPLRARTATGATSSWWRRHLSFGWRGLVNGVLLEAHLRVDVMMLSYFLADGAIGIYAFAMLFAEGLYQIPVVIRTVAFPRIVQFASRGDREGLAHASRRLSLASGATAAACAGLIAVVFPWLAGAFDPQFATTGFPVLMILLGGITVYAFVVPFDQLLLQSGLPGRQSMLMAAYVGTNIMLNLMLIPRFGLTGAALATALAMVLAAGLVLGASWLWLGYRGGVLLHRAPAA